MRSSDIRCWSGLTTSGGCHYQFVYGRTVADVKCRGEDVGRHQVAGGRAWVYKRYATRDDGALFKMQYGARWQRLGLWADAEPVAPWEWRRERSGGS
ncbi:thermonuclease family protein [Variovorax sp. LjRoot130]|uniref:thermonuclease family protein n=1 Tax=Variovorax sp. LjRoot130 TaxID=3342261 RepID=UPI003F515B0C